MNRRSSSSIKDSHTPFKPAAYDSGRRSLGGSRNSTSGFNFNNDDYDEDIGSGIKAGRNTGVNTRNSSGK